MSPPVNCGGNLRRKSADVTANMWSFGVADLCDFDFEHKGLHYISDYR